MRYTQKLWPTLVTCNGWLGTMHNAIVSCPKRQAIREESADVVWDIHSDFGHLQLMIGNYA